MLATGSGAASRAVMGTAVFFGMLVATFVGVFIYPALFVLVDTLATGRKARKAPVTPPIQHPAPEGAGH